jgi:hypothetical protein
MSAARRGAQSKGEKPVHKTAILTVAFAGLAGVSAAEASSLGRPCTSAPESQWLTLDDLKAKAAAQGYTVRKAKLEKACGEIYVVDRGGARAELFMDPTSGEIVARKD